MDRQHRTTPQRNLDLDTSELTGPAGFAGPRLSIIGCPATHEGGHQLRYKVPGMSVWAASPTAVVMCALPTRRGHRSLHRRSTSGSTWRADKRRVTPTRRSGGSRLLLSPRPIGHDALVTDIAADALLNVVGGDTHAVAQVEAVEHERLADVATTLRPLVLTRAALARVLSDVRDGTVSSAQAQRWASFVRRGYAAGTNMSVVRPIEIDYEDESAIVEPLSRLDELGDVLDGTMAVDELGDWIARLST